MLELIIDIGNSWIGNFLVSVFFVFLYYLASMVFIGFLLDSNTKNAFFLHKGTEAYSISYLAIFLGILAALNITMYVAGLYSVSGREKLLFLAVFSFGVTLIILNMLEFIEETMLGGRGFYDSLVAFILVALLLAPSKKLVMLQFPENVFLIIGLVFAWKGFQSSLIKKIVKKLMIPINNFMHRQIFERHRKNE